ncbi:ATP-binding protein [Vibrio sp. HN007]|uniref:ATP-binding protein n=1 Tax=Vibrio iocasae TaxID=3098914 RepID=UPI0035D4B67A
MSATVDMFEAQYEDNFLLRDLGSIVKRADIALTELVANAYDAGASKVDIHIPEGFNQLLTISDDGVGMTEENFRQRWMTLRYNRTLHQGEHVEFPPERQGIKRRAFGRNGIGRHGLLCFNDEYSVETRRNGYKHTFDVSTKLDGKPLSVKSFQSETMGGHGTKLLVSVERNLPTPAYIAEVISARFIATPDFTVSVNGQVLALHQHPGLVDTCEVDCEGTSLRFTLIDSKINRKDSIYSGVAIWVGGRLVGEPDWKIAGVSMLDSRRSFANRYLLIVETDELRDEVAEDWSGFRANSELMKSVAYSVKEYINRKRQELSRDEVVETKKGLLLANKADIVDMSKLAKKELMGFMDDILTNNPDVNLDTLQLAVKAAINLEKSRAGTNLLSKLAMLSEDEVESLDNILEEWSAHDALIALSEIDQRLKLIEVLRRFSADRSADELKTIHPLIFKARWLFGPEYESSEYSSNVALQQTVHKVFGQKVDRNAFINSRKRPDIVVLKESAIQALATESFDGELSHVQNVLLIEVKRGGFSIGREEVNQADGYVQDIAYSGIIDVTPKINAFVVGHEIQAKTAKVKEVRDSEDDKTVIGTVRAVTFSVLIDTAQKRLFGLRNRLNERYDALDDDLALFEVLGEEQLTLQAQR